MNQIKGLEAIFRGERKVNNIKGLAKTISDFVDKNVSKSLGTAICSGRADKALGTIWRVCARSPVSTKFTLDESDRSRHGSRPKFVTR